MLLKNFSYSHSFENNHTESNDRKETAEFIISEFRTWTIWDLLLTFVKISRFTSTYLIIESWVEALAGNQYFDKSDIEYYLIGFFLLENGKEMKFGHTKNMYIISINFIKTN